MDPVRSRSFAEGDNVLTFVFPFPSSDLNDWVLLSNF